MAKGKQHLIAGRCYCGAVRYKIQGEIEHVCICHCRSCQLASGAPCVGWLTVERSQVMLSGALNECYGAPQVQRCYCANCGTPISYSHSARPDHVDITLATLEDQSAVQPSRHIWVSHKVPWLSLVDGLPQFDEFSGAMD
ncbi:GFA family protein [Simiduia aestuariiviva]|uniref:CENP-V/GFA domain-containing protein n=1 Tax=Simiduia aestuariiviva TaxID=1510459 RepID=A0A839UW76_9GAMM|nr:hypothetical protein [Simiduia aestuariiviva]